VFRNWRLRNGIFIMARDFDPVNLRHKSEVGHFPDIFISVVVLSTGV
jgi:hypothetical protein